MAGLVTQAAALAAAALVATGVWMALPLALEGASDAPDAPVTTAGDGAGRERAPEAPSGAVVGRVRDWNGAPIAGALVRLPAHGLSNATDADGRFRFFGVPAGSAVVRAEANGFVSNARTVRVAADVVSEVNLRLETATSKAPDVSIQKLDGRLSCVAVAVRLGVLCAGANDHRVNLTGRVVDVVVETVWDDAAAERLNVSASPPGARDALTGRPARSFTSDEGPPIARLEFAPPRGARAFDAGVRYAADAVGPQLPASYSVYATIFHDRLAPFGYSVFQAP